MATRRADALKEGDRIMIAEEPATIDTLTMVTLEVGSLEGDGMIELEHIHVQAHRDNGDGVETFLLHDNLVDLAK